MTIIKNYRILKVKIHHERMVTTMKKFAALLLVLMMVLPVAVFAWYIVVQRKAAKLFW